MVLGNRQDMVDSLVNGSSLYLSSESTIDLICTRFMSMTNTLEFVDAFNITGRYRTTPDGYFPGQSATGVTTDTSISEEEALYWPGIHKTGTERVTLGDYIKPLDYANITQIVAGSLTLTGALTVGAISFGKTTKWNPDATIVTNPDTDGKKDSVITDVIKMPMNATFNNFNGTTVTDNTVYMNYQFVNRVVTGYMDMVMYYNSVNLGSTIYPIYDRDNPSCQYAVNQDVIVAGDGYKFKTGQSMTFDLSVGFPTGNTRFNVGQYVVIITGAGNTLNEYKKYQHSSGTISDIAVATSKNMIYGVVTAYTPGGTPSVTITTLYYRQWCRQSGIIAGESALTGLANEIKIITAMPFLLPAPKSRIPNFGAYGQVDAVNCQKITTRVYAGGVDDPLGNSHGIFFSDIGIDAVSVSGRNSYFNGVDTISPFTFLTIEPNLANSIDLDI
jgi:hypothetical protein